MCRGQGAFLTADPTGYANPAGPSSWNMYAYVEGDPVNYNDPTELCPLCLMAPPDPITGAGGGIIWAPRPEDTPNLGPSLAERQHAARINAAFLIGAAERFSITTTINYGNGVSQSFVNEGQFRSTLGNLLGMVQTGLDIVGLVPGIGEIADATNAGLYALQGDWGNAGLSLASMIPIGVRRQG